MNLWPTRERTGSRLSAGWRYASRTSAGAASFGGNATDVLPGALAGALAGVITASDHVDGPPVSNDTNRAAPPINTTVPAVRVRSWRRRTRLRPQRAERWRRHGRRDSSMSLRMRAVRTQPSTAPSPLEGGRRGRFGGQRPLRRLAQTAFRPANGPSTRSRALRRGASAELSTTDP